MSRPATAAAAAPAPGRGSPPVSRSAALVAILVLLPFMIQTLTTFTQSLAGRIIAG